MVKVFSSILTGAAALGCVMTTSISAATVDPQLHRSFRSNSAANIMIKMKSDSTDSIIRGLNRRSYDSRISKISSLHMELVENARVSQARVLDAIQGVSSNFESDNLPVDVKSLWISNELYIPNATPELIDQLAEMDDIDHIYEEHIITLDELILADDGSSDIMPNREENIIEWGIEKVDAPTVWLEGNTGEGVVVGSIDTGVQGTHEALQDNFVGEYGWFDPYDQSPEPIDTNGHGTHTMGTIAGQNGIGVAPGAKWMACRGCNTNSCTEFALKTCGQFILCPTDSEGNNADCSYAPQLSSNSWGGAGNSFWYKSVVDAWEASGIIPIFAQGNSGPRCGTANSPGDYPNVIGVGATTESDELASFSSVGPARSGLIKPNIAAPGKQVNSAWIGTDTAYRSISGTSMACPHIAGVVALMLSGKENLTYQQIFKAMTVGASREMLTGPGKTCGGIDELTYPNNAFGFGQAHASDALNACDGTTYSPAPAPTPPTECSYEWNTHSCVPRDSCEGFCIPGVAWICPPSSCEE